tara:strand:+ start:2642 stop:2908 length:267 start_codon:yes stop_codon:yes gene_type:complete
MDNNSIPPNAHIPPVIGEYGYYNSRFSNEKSDYYCILISGRDSSETHERSVHYSMSENITEFIPFTTNQGKIKSIVHVKYSNFNFLSK